MRRKIPSIDSLIAFEAAARHLNFTRTAEELSVTQSAVGRQIAGLEDFLGSSLFNRVRKRVSLTEVGELYAKRVRENLERMERDTLTAMAHRSRGGIIELAVTPTFATRWLIPRLATFYSLHANIVVNLTTRAEPFLFKDTPFDAAIHFGDPVWPGSVTRYLFGEESVVVCSPDLINDREKVTPRDLCRFTLLHQAARPDAWRRWFAQGAVHDVDSMKGQRYELFSMLVVAAKARLGVALVPRFLVRQELTSGELVIPIERGLASTCGYFLVYPERKQNSPLIRSFEEWLMAATRTFLGESASN